MVNHIDIYSHNQQKQLILISPSSLCHTLIYPPSTLTKYKPPLSIPLNLVPSRFLNGNKESPYFIYCPIPEKYDINLVWHIHLPLVIYV